MMFIRFGDLKRLIREALDDDEQNDGSIDEVDLDPSNNPGRPNDAHEYIGMRPAATAAMSHPAIGGSGASIDTSSPPDESQ